MTDTKEKSNTIAKDNCLRKLRQSMEERSSGHLKIIFLYFVISMLPLIFSLNMSTNYFRIKSKMFYFEEHAESWNFYRFLWCVSCTLWGLISRSLTIYLKGTKIKVYRYCSQYPLQILAMSALVFCVLHIYKGTSNYLFYFSSFPLCFILGFITDEFWNYLNDYFKKKQGK